MVIDLYKNISDNRDINKNVSLLSSGISCILKDDSCSFQNPTLVISSSLFNSSCNYVYMQEYSRYYFVTDTKLLRGDKIMLVLSLDVLYTYRTEIMQCVGVVKRSNSQGNNYLPDEMMKITSRVKTDMYQSNKSFKTDSIDYVLTVCG